MGRDDLICANCSGRVVEGRCPVCREARAQLYGEPRVPPVLYLALAAIVLVALVIALTHVAG